jgi:HD-GYP domain-containing protein (c-di-GMP phosphodiesterase class II)
MGLNEDELVHIRRGALLHDIGKLGIPDSILLKPGKLTEEEWAIMKTHPGLAYQWLAPIAYLKPALDIPYCHHEKWDGSGYPRGLQGEQIPLAARIFAVIDVWDALSSDRPYRQRWPAEQVYAHLQASSGTHFDPVVVQAFLQMQEILASHPCQQSVPDAVEP